VQTVQGKAVFCNKHLINFGHCTYYGFRCFLRKTDPLAGSCISVFIFLFIASAVIYCNVLIIRQKIKICAV